MSIFFLSLNPVGELATAAEFSGNVTSTGAINYTVPLEGNISLANANAMFKYNTDSKAHDSTIIGARTNGEGGFIDMSTPQDKINGQTDFLNKLSVGVFGYEGGVEFFSNISMLRTNIIAANTACLSSINTYESAYASTELVNAILANNNTKKRFTLGYNAHLNNIATPNTVYNNITVSFGDASCVVDVTTDDTGNVAFVSLVSHTINGAFTAGNNVVSSNVINTRHIEWHSITPTQAAMMNGTLNTNRTLLTNISSPQGAFTTGSITYSYKAIITGNSSNAQCPVSVHVTNANGIIEILKNGTTTGGTFSTSDTACTLIDVAYSGNNAILNLAGNSAGIAYLNNSTITSQAVSVPVEVNDIIRVKYTIASSSGQTNINGDEIAVEQTRFAQFTIIE